MPDYSLMTNFNWYRVVLRMPDGAEHELRPTDYSPFGGGKSFLWGYYTANPYTHGTMRYHSFDGSYLYATITTEGNWTVYLPDGTKVVQTPDGIQRIQDTNGNKIKIWTENYPRITHYQDEQTGREIRYEYNPAANNGLGQGRVYYKTVTGVEMYIDINFDVTTVAGQVYKVNDWIPGQFGPSPCTRNLEINTDIPVIRTIVLPQTEPLVTRQFTFHYSSDTTESASSFGVRFSCTDPPQMYTRTASKGWGFLSRVETPSGAEIDYTYFLDSTHFPMDTDELAKVSVTQKKLIHDGTEDIWGYSIHDGGSTVTNPDGSTVTESKFNHFRDMGGAMGKSGLSYKTVRPFMKTERHWTYLVFSGANRMSPNGSVDFNSVVDFEYTTLLDAAGNDLRMSAKAFQYDYNGNLIQTTECDWFDPALVAGNRDAEGVPTGVPGSAVVLRTVNNSYHNSASTSTSTNVYAKRDSSMATPLILNAMQQTTVGPAITQLSYDYQAYGVAPTNGNVTSQSVWDDLDNKWITSSQTYNSYGNVETKTDPRGKVAQFLYGDLTHAMPTGVVVDPQNGTGLQTTTMAYDFYTGAVTSQTDANGKVSNIDYTNQLLGTVDPFARPGFTLGPEVTINGSPHRHRVTTIYNDSLRQVITASDLNSQDDQLLKTRTTSDQMGRIILAEQTEDGTNYSISSRKVYEQMGKITYSSNPARNAPAGIDGWTRVSLDTADRVIEAATFSGATQPAASGYTNGTGKVTTVYDASFTTVTDQAGNVRRSLTDSLGRLVRVDEPDASTNNLGTTASPVQPTSYEYDVFGNLKTVTQGAQTRTFNYDSLSRLRSAFNPESGTITYVYDDNGNLTQKTDARSIVSTYVYDALNRATSRTYSDGTPTVSHTYDTVALNGKGRLASVSSSVSSYSYSGYDAAGKPLGASQVIGSQTYTLGYDYYLAGNVKKMTYPSGNTVNYAYDSAGRLNSAAGDLGDAQRNYATGIVYDAVGRMTQEQFGTTPSLFNKLFYNTRGQLAEIRVGTTGNNTDWERGAIINHYSNNYGCWGASCNAPDNNGNLMKQDIYIPGQEMRWQQYGYDRLNRLTSVREIKNSVDQWQQVYTYDRYGNRRIDTNPSHTWGGVNNLDFELETASNRLYAPGDLALADASRRMQYDSAGNLKTDVYTGQGQRTYDAANRMKQAWAANQWQTYSYDGDGRRVKRIVSGVETWQVYGLGGELLAEYAQNAPAASPQKEHGYRNGQLLITATAGTSWGTAPSFGSPNPLVAGATEVKASHITVLRTAINDLRAHLSLGAYAWQYSATTNDYISANPILEMRTALDHALGAPPAPGYAAGLAQGQPIKAIHIQELRDRVLAAWSTGTSLEINWLVADHLGTPRMIFDQTGSLENTKRHDYLPFGEELTGQGGRSTAQGYVSDDTRQKFTSYERDSETELDFAQARYYASMQGRFTSPDPLGGHTQNPQTLNRYNYVGNNPQRFTDPSGLDFYLTCEGNTATCQGGRTGHTDQKGNFTATIISNDKNGGLVDQDGNTYATKMTGAGVSFSGAGCDEFIPGVFLNGTSATTVQGSGDLAGFTFEFSASNLNSGITASGSWSFNGTANQAQKTLESVGFVKEGFDAANLFHANGIDYNAATFRSRGSADDGAGSAHLTAYVPVTTSYQPSPDGGFFPVRIPKATVPTRGDAHFGEHNPYHSWKGLKKHAGEVKRSIRP